MLWMKFWRSACLRWMSSSFLRGLLGLGAGLGVEEGVLGLLAELLVFVDHGLALLAEFLGLLLRLLLGVAELGHAFLGLVIAVVGLGHVDGDQFQGGLREQGRGTGGEGAEGEERADHLVHIGVRLRIRNGCRRRS